MRELRFIRKQVAVLMLAAFMVCVDWYSPNGGISPAHAEEEYDALHTMLALNMAIVTAHRIVNTKDRITLTQEYDYIINNLKIGNIEADGDMLETYNELMDFINEKRLREDKAELVQARYNKREQRQFANALSGIRAYGGSIWSMLGSLAVSCVSQYFSYQDAKAEIAEELSDELRQLEEQDIKYCNDLQKTLLNSSWKLLRKYALPDEYRIAQVDLDEYYKALSTQEASTRKNLLRLREDTFGAYPPYWIYRALAARESGDEADMRRCYDKFDEVWRPVLRQDPFKVEALKFRIGELAANGTASDTQQMRALLNDMRQYTPRNDWQNNIFTGVAYFAIGNQNEAIDCVWSNVGFGYESNISSRILAQMKRGKLDIDSLSPELSVLAQGIEQMQSMSAEIGEDIAGALVDLFEGREDIACAVLEQIAENGDTAAAFTLTLIEEMKKNPDWSKWQRYNTTWSKASKDDGHKERLAKLEPIIEVYAKQGNLTAKLFYTLLPNADHQMIAQVWESLKEVQATDIGSSAIYSIIGAYENGNKNYTEAVEWWQKAAERGYMLAQYNLGTAYHAGIGVEKDDKQAAEWFRKAADQGHPGSQAYLGYMYNNGDGVQQNNEKAVYWWRKAAEQGRADAQYWLGFVYSIGQGVQKDDEQAVNWWRKAAEQEYLLAQFFLGKAYHDGIGVVQDYAQSVEWYRKVANRGDAGAQYEIGVAYYYGKGVTQDYKQAVNWFRKAADQGHADAQFCLGFMYINGEGVQQDEEQGIYWLRKTGDEWNIDTQFFGNYPANDEGTLKQSFAWLLKAAEQGHAIAQYNIGFIYFDGAKDLAVKDESQAIEWWRKASEQGYAPAQYELGRAYYNGKGVKKDKQEAARWLQKAADQGHERAMKLLKEL